MNDAHRIIALFSVCSGWLQLCLILARKLRRWVICVCKVLAHRLVWAWKATGYIILLVGHVKVIFEQLLAAVDFSIEVLTIIVVVHLAVADDVTAPERASDALYVGSYIIIVMLVLEVITLVVLITNVVAFPLKLSLVSHEALSNLLCFPLVFFVN